MIILQQAISYAKAVATSSINANEMETSELCLRDNYGTKPSET